jgi:hypothetical protein
VDAKHTLTKPLLDARITQRLHVMIQHPDVQQMRQHDRLNLRRLAVKERLNLPDDIRRLRQQIVRFAGSELLELLRRNCWPLHSCGSSDSSGNAYILRRHIIAAIKDEASE